VFGITVEHMSSENMDTIPQLAWTIQAHMHPFAPLRKSISIFFGVIVWLLCVMLRVAQPNSNLSSPTVDSPLPIPHTTFPAFYLFITLLQFFAFPNSLDTLIMIT